MKSGAVSWVFLGLAVFVLGVQLHHRAVCPVRPVAAARPAAGAPSPDGSGLVTIFGHEYSESEVRGWFGQVCGKYCLCGGQLVPAHLAQGAPMTYEAFVRALKSGFYFPELKGAGVRSDGERVVLKHKPLGRVRHGTVSRVHVQGAVPVGTTDSSLDDASRLGSSQAH